MESGEDTTKEERKGTAAPTQEIREQDKSGCLPDMGLPGGDAPLTTSRPRGDEGDELDFEQTELKVPVCAVAYTC